MMVFISCNLELEALMEYHMVLVYTGNQLQLREDTDLGLLGFVVIFFFFLRNKDCFTGKHCRLFYLCCLKPAFCKVIYDYIGTSSLFLLHDNRLK